MPFVWVCLRVSNEYQLAVVTFLLCSEFVNIMLLITVQYKQSDKNKNASKLRACLSVSPPANLPALSLYASCQHCVATLT